MVSDAVHPWNTGGKEKRHHELLTRLTAQGFEVTVYTMKWWEGPNRIQRDGLTYVALCPLLPLYVGPRRSIRQAVVFALSCLRLVTRRFDVLEVDAIPFLPLAPARLVSLIRRKPMVTTWHEFWGRDYWVDYLGRRGRVAAAIERAAMRLPTRIIAASEGTAQRLREAGGTQVEVHVIPNGVVATDPSRLPVRERAAGEPADLLCVGRLLDHKRVDVAIDALAELLAGGTDARLEVIGEGPELENLQEQTRQLKLEQYVRFTPFLADHQAVLSRMARADIVLFPSVREGFGMVALEAMSVGTPVITSNAAHNFAQYLVDAGHNGFVCADQAVAVKTAVEQALRDRNSLSEGAIRTASAYDWDELAARAAAVYHP